MARNSTQTAEAAAQTSGNFVDPAEVLGLIKPTDPAYPKSYWLDGIMKDSEGNERYVKANRKGSGKQQVIELTTPTRTSVATLYRVNGHFQGETASGREIGGINRVKGAVMITTRKGITNWIDDPRKTESKPKQSLAEMLKELDTAASATAAAEDDGVPF